MVVTNVAERLRMEELWSPAAFSAEFGHQRHDIVNVKTNRAVRQMPLSKFWDGFVRLKDRARDDRGDPMLLKLKDWPPDNDFAAALPSRFADLMGSIPLRDYTLRSGRHNLASFMPDFFVRPDLGPKMYIAYGNVLHPDKGTTNLHIDMSDACNVMLHVGIPEDGNYQEHYRLEFAPSLPQA